MTTIREVLRIRDGYDEQTIDAMLREFNEELAFCVDAGDLKLANICYKTISV
jgi:hypothetical protein